MFVGSLPGVLAPLGQQLNAPVIGMVSYGDAYLMVASDGGLFNFSTGPFIGSLASIESDIAVVGVAAFTN